MADPALQTAALGALEFVINKALQLDPASLQRLSKLDGKVLMIECLDPALKVFCLPSASGLQLKSWCEESQVHSALSGRLSDFVKLLQAEDKAAALINGSLTVHGDSSDFIALQSALAELDIDWEQPLAKLLGDVGGHQLGKFLRGSFAWGKQMNSNLQRQVEEFIHQEARLLPPRDELEGFYSDVSALNLRVDRLQAHIERIKQRRQA